MAVITLAQDYSERWTDHRFTSKHLCRVNARALHEPNSHCRAPVPLRCSHTRNAAIAILSPNWTVCPSPVSKIGTAADHLHCLWASLFPSPSANCHLPLKYRTKRPSFAPFASGLSIKIKNKSLVDFDCFHRRNSWRTKKTPLPTNPRCNLTRKNPCRNTSVATLNTVCGWLKRAWLPYEFIPHPFKYPVRRKRPQQRLPGRALLDQNLLFIFFVLIVVTRRVLGKCPKQVPIFEKKARAYLLQTKHGLTALSPSLKYREERKSSASCRLQKKSQAFSRRLCSCYQSTPGVGPTTSDPSLLNFPLPQSNKTYCGNPLRNSAAFHEYQKALSEIRSSYNSEDCCMQFRKPATVTPEIWCISP